MSDFSWALGLRLRTCSRVIGKSKAHRGGAEKSKCSFGRICLHKDCADPEEQRSRLLGPHHGRLQDCDGNAGSDTRNSMSLWLQDESSRYGGSMDHRIGKTCHESAETQRKARVGGAEDRKTDKSACAQNFTAQPRAAAVHKLSETGSIVEEGICAPLSV